MTDQSALAESLQYLDDVDALKSTPAQSHRLGSLTLESHADQRWHSALTALVLGPRLADKATVDGAILFILLGLGYDGLWQSKLPARCRARLDPVLTPQSISLGSTLLSVYLDRHGAKRDHADYGLASIEQSDFLAECDKLKDVFRATRLHDDSRHENTAEHSFHVALHALLLEDFAKEPVDVFHVVRMLLVHDIVEIDAGDTPIHGAGDPQAQAEKEQAAADRIFGLCPPRRAQNSGRFGPNSKPIPRPKPNSPSLLIGCHRFAPILRTGAALGSITMLHTTNSSPASGKKWRTERP